MTGDLHLVMFAFVLSSSFLLSFHSFLSFLSFMFIFERAQMGVRQRDREPKDLKDPI